MAIKSAESFDDLVRMLEQRLKRQEKAVEDTRAQLEQARAAAKSKR